MSNGHWLVSDFDHRDPKDDLHDIDGGKYLDALQSLPQSQRQLLQDSDMHVELEELSDGAYHVTKIIKKREPEYSQSAEHFFVFDKEGKRINLTEEEYDKLLGIQHDSDDVFENAEALDLQSLNSEFVAPRDVWDILFDNTSFSRQVERLLDSEKFQAQSGKEQRKQLAKLQEEIYSADWFPYPQDKRLKDPRSVKIARYIEENDLTKQQLGSLIGPKVTDKRPEMIAKIRSEAKKMAPGPDKAQMLIKANKMSEQMSKSWKKGGIKDPIPQSDRTKLWTMWREKNVREKGSAPLMSWQFETMLKAKLQRQITAGSLSLEEANQRLLKSMESIYDRRPKSMLGNVAVPPMEHLEVAAPAWLENAPPIVEPVVNDDVDQSWEAPEGFAETQVEFGEDEEWLEQNLLSGGLE